MFVYLKCFIYVEEGISFLVEFFFILVFSLMNVLLDWRMVGCVIWKLFGRFLIFDDFVIIVFVMVF